MYAKFDTNMLKSSNNSSSSSITNQLQWVYSAIHAKNHQTIRLFTFFLSLSYLFLTKQNKTNNKYYRVSVSRFCENCRCIFLLLIVQSKQKSKTCNFKQITQTNSVSAVFVCHFQTIQPFWISTTLEIDTLFFICSAMNFHTCFPDFSKCLNEICSFFSLVVNDLMQLPCATFHGTRPMSMPMIMMTMMPLFKKKARRELYRFADAC